LSFGDGPLVTSLGLTKTYPGVVPVTALADATFTVDRGEMVALVGRSGSGKSTLLTLLGLLDVPTGGRLHLGSTDVTGLRPRQLADVRRSRIGFVFQSFNLVPTLTARENVELALRYQQVRRRDHRSRAAEALEQVGLTHRADARVSTLSGGEHQRVAIARALVKEPELILADEPTGNLDSTNEQIVIDLLRKACGQGRTIIVVTHSPGVAERADRVLRVHDGIVHGGQEPDGAEPDDAEPDDAQEPDDARQPDGDRARRGDRAGHPA
jgi:putative ABC transport system ATP-binding protein